MHWGTVCLRFTSSEYNFLIAYPMQFILTEEPIMEPVELLKEALKKAGLQQTGVFDAIDCGASETF